MNQETEQIAQRQIKSKPLTLIITKLGTQPEYLLMIAIGLLGGGMGLGTTAVGLVKENETLTILGFVSWVLLLIVSFLVVRFVKRKSDKETSPVGFSLGGKAEEAFFSGQSAEPLQGRWRVYWFEGTGDSRRAYDPDPKETIDVIAYKSKVSCVSYDPSTEYTYWLEGRLSDRKTLSMIYWSNPERRVSGLSGVVLLDVDDSFEHCNKRMKGWWHGRTRDDKFICGEVEWEKMGK